jgi:hypothetical protein
MNFTQMPRILSQLSDEDDTIRDMLRSKISYENYALEQCKLHCHGKKLGIFSEIISTEFQFDRKKLFIYMKKYTEVSVCTLVRRLYDLFKMQIKILEVDNANIVHDLVLKYHDLSQLHLSLGDIDPETLAYSFLHSKPGSSDHPGEPNFDSETPSSGTPPDQMHDPGVGFSGVHRPQPVMRLQRHSAPPGLGHLVDSDPVPNTVPLISPRSQSLTSLQSYADSFETLDTSFPSSAPPIQRDMMMPPHPFPHIYTSFLVLRPSDVRPSTTPPHVPPFPVPTVSLAPPDSDFLF